jgi:hypothetical protein
MATELVTANGEPQMTLALFDEQPEILRKPVQAVHMAITGGLQTKMQRLAWNAMLKHAHDTHAKFPGQTHETYKISRVELMRVIGYTSPNRKYLIEALRKMMTLSVEWDILKQDGDKKWVKCVLLPFVEVDGQYVHYSYVSQIKPLLFSQDTYARLDLSIQRSFRLDCSAALYEWVNRFRSNPSKRTNKMPWEDWRWVVYGETEDGSVLREYKTFKRDKLKPAIAEINGKSDLDIELLEDKDGGRSVRYLQFIVNEKAQFRIENGETGDTDASDILLQELGLSERDRKNILKKYSSLDIAAHHSYTLRRMRDEKLPKLTKPGAYFKTAITQGYARDEVKAAPTPEDKTNSIAAIHSEFIAYRVREAEAMFNEMMESEREDAITDYNDVQAKAKNSGAIIPENVNDRKRRHMSPFFAWLANKTWGEPEMPELIKWAVDNGSLVLPTAQAA